MPPWEKYSRVGVTPTNKESYAYSGAPQLDPIRPEEEAFYRQLAADPMQNPVNLPEPTRLPVPSALPSQAPWEKYQSTKATQNKITPVIEDPNFFQRVGEDADRRSAMLDDIYKATDAGEQTELESGLQLFGKVGAGFAGDIVAEGLKSIGSGISAIAPEPNPMVSGAYQGVMNTGVVKSIGKGIEAAGEAYDDFSKEHPRAGRNIDAIANLAMLGLASKRPTRAGTIKIKPDVEKIKAMSQAKYDNALASGIELPGEFSQKLSAAGSKYLPKTEMQADLVEGTPSFKVANLLKKYEGKSLTIEDIDALDKYLTDESFGLWGTKPAEAKNISDMQDALRETLETYPVGKELKTARDLWAQQAKMRDIERIIENASMTDNPATSIRTAFGSLVKNKKRFAGYTPAEKKLIRKAAKTGVVTGLLNVAGSRLGAIGTGVGTGNIPLAGAVYAAGSAARKGAETIQARKGQKVIEEIARRGLPKKSAKLPLPSPKNALIGVPGINPNAGAEQNNKLRRKK